MRHKLLWLTKTACALLTDGTAKCWGSNAEGDIGDGILNDSDTPVVVAGLSGATSISGSMQTFCAILSDSDVKCWGNDGWFDLNGGIPGATANGSSGLHPIATQKPGITNAIQVATGDEATCALISGGTVSCWGGQEDASEIGNRPDNMNVSTPLVIPGITTATQIAAGYLTNCILLALGSIQCLGYGGDGELGNGTMSTTNTPVTVSGISNATQITGGQNWFCALLADTTVKCWGSDSEYQLGDGTQNNTSTPVAVAGLSGVKAVYAGWGSTTCAVLTSGDVMCWGYNNHGQIGDGTTTTRPAPTLVPNLHDVSTLAVGNTHTCALLTDGTVRCWGSDGSSQLGDGGTTDSHSPINVNWFSNFANLSAGSGNGGQGEYTCGQLTDGTVRCWGGGSSGEMGGGGRENGTQISQSAVFSLTGATQIEATIAGGSCAVVSGGTVDCWGGIGGDEMGFPVLGLREVSGFIP